MTNIENLVTDKKTSEDMFKAGIKYETAFVWVRYSTSPSVFGVISRKDFEADKSLYDKVINAFTAGEMMQVLPKIIHRDELQDGFERAYFFTILGSENHRNGQEYTCWNASYSRFTTKDEMRDGPHRLVFLYQVVTKYGHDNVTQSLAKLCLWCRQERYI